MPNIVYLDYNATTPLRPQVLEHMTELMRHPHNPSSAHFYGREGRKYIENARATIAEAVNCFTNEVIFTASGTEANNTVLKAEGARHVIISSVEHSSIIKTVPDADRIPVDAQGMVQLDALEAMLAKEKRPALVSVMLANNETGAIQPVVDVVKLCRQFENVRVHTDAAQALGKIPVDFSALGVDMMTLSAHKMGGPQGAAALVVRNDLPIKPLLTGGGQELGRRAGTENVAAIAGFARAVEIAAGDGEQLCRLRGWLNAMEEDLLAHCPQAVVFSKQVERLPNTTAITMPGVTAETQLMSFDLAGVAISAGSACSSGRIEASHVAKAMGFKKEAGSAIRISGGWNTVEEDIRKMAEAWKTLYDRAGTRAKEQAGT